MAENPAPPPAPKGEPAPGDFRYAATTAPLLPSPSDKQGSMGLGFGLFWGCFVVWYVVWVAVVLSFHLNASAPTVLFVGGWAVWCVTLLAVVKKRTGWGVLLGTLTALALALLLWSLCF